MRDAQRELIAVLREARSWLALPGNEFSWSHWNSPDEASREIDELIASIEAGIMPERMKLALLFAPTGSIQEVSESSGWGTEFLALAQRFDAAEERVYGTRNLSKGA